jgi:hypothetical protein
MEIFVGKLVEASPVILGAPGLFERPGNCCEWQHQGTDPRRLAELYHHLQPSNRHNEFLCFTRGVQRQKHTAPALDAQLLKNSFHHRSPELHED